MNAIKKTAYLSLLVLITSVIKLPATEGKHVLMLGGNGFIGGKTTINLFQNGHSLTLLNRGNVYYDSDLKIDPLISKHILCDREKSLLFECKELTDDSKYYDVVIDFTSYSPKQLQQVVELLSARVGLYLFISSEAVYEVSSKNHTRPSREEEAIRPVSPKLRRELQKEEPYGDQKLGCEEVLQNQQKEGGVPYVILRLPVVIGPRDTTFRWWIYQLWVLTHAVIHHPVHIPEGVRSNLFSMVYVDDVADVISRIVAMDKTTISLIQNTTFNLALKEHLSLPRIIKDIAGYYGIDQVQHEGDDNSTWYTYPAGAKGPLDIALAERVLEWEPVSWKEAKETTCEFYHRAMMKVEYAREKEMVLADVLDNIVPDEYYDDFLMTLKEHFGENVFNGVNLEGGIPDRGPEIETGSTLDSGNGTNEKVVDEL